MAAGGSQEGIESFLTCSICMEPFRRPKILPCVHTFCCQCLKSYLCSGASNRKKGGYPCPTCRQHVPVAKPSKAPETWPDQLKDNFVLSSMLETLNQQKSAAALSLPSQPTSPTTSGTGTSQSAGGSSTAESGAAPGCTCRSAPEMVCWDCAVIVCALCSATSHADCSQVQNISTAGPEKRQEMIDWLPQLNDRLNDLERRQASAQTLLHSLRARHQSTQDQVTQAAKDAILIVQLQEQKIKQTMDKEFEVILRHHQQQLKESSEAVEDLKSLKEELERCVVERDLELLQQAQCLKHRYNAVIAPEEGNMRGSEDQDQDQNQDPDQDQGSDQDQDSYRDRGQGQDRGQVQGQGQDGGQDQFGDLEPGTFVATSLTELKSLVLVGVYHCGLDQSPVTSAPTSPLTSEKSWCYLPDGPVLHHRTRCHSLPSQFPLTSSPSSVQPDTSAGTQTSTTTTDEGGTTEVPYSLSSPLLLSGQRPVTLQHTSKFSARIKGDKVEALIRDLVVLANGWLVATDLANRCVKCYFKAHPEDTKFHCKRLVLPHPPYGVCSVEGQLVAVTVPKERQLQMVMARPQLVPLTILTLPLQAHEAAWAVSSLGEQRLAVTTCPQGKVGSVLILQMTGDNNVQLVARYSSLVTTPLYLSVTTDHHIVITDPTSCHVSCITSGSGHAVFHFHANGKVMGVTCHSKLLLVVDQSPVLSLLTAEGRCVHSLPLPKGKAGCPHPRAVAVATDGTVWISDDGGKLNLFRLRWQDPPVT